MTSAGPYAYAAGLVLNNIGETQSARAQAREAEHEAENQALFDRQVGEQFGRNRDANTFDARRAGDQVAEGRVLGAQQGNAKTSMFDGPGGFVGDAARIATDAGGRRAQAFAGMQAPTIGIHDRGRIAQDVNSNIAGIRQRADRSLSFLPRRLDVASEAGSGFRDMGSILQSYGYGETAKAVSGKGKGKGKATTEPTPTTEPNSTTNQSSSTDLWGDTSITGD